MTALQLAVLHLLHMLLDLLWESLSQEDKAILLQVLTNYLLCYTNCQVFFIYSILRPVDKAVPIRRPTHTHTHTL